MLYLDAEDSCSRLNKTESAVFLYCWFSLFLKDPFFPDYLAAYSRINQCMHYEIYQSGGVKELMRLHKLYIFHMEYLKNKMFKVVKTTYNVTG